MATPGMVLVRKDMKIIMKVISWDQGENASLLAQEIRHLLRPPTIEEVAQFAGYTSFGTRQYFVILTPTEIYYQGNLKLGEVFRETFEEATYNPWMGRLDETGHVAMVDLTP